MLLLISSNAAQRYRDDIVRLLALPAGTDVQFRYDLQYLDPAVLVRAQQSKLSGEKALVCFMMTDAAAGTARLASCRAVSIRRSALVGSSCILTLTAGDYLHPLDDAAIRAQLTPQELALVPAYSGSPPIIGGKFAIEVAATLEAGKVAALGKEMTAFEETTAHLSGFPAFAPVTGIAFFAIRAIAVPERQSSWFRKAAPSSATYSHGTYELMSGVRYELLIYTYRPAGSAVGPGWTKLTVDSDEKAVRFTSNKQIVLDSRYDLHRFTFATDDQLDPLPAGLTVALSIPDAATPPNFTQRCDIRLLARFEGRRFEAVFRMLVIAIGTSSAAIVGVIFKDHFNVWVGAAMCIGPLIAAYAATFPMLRKSG
jgi:hypothetical protein